MLWETVAIFCYNYFWCATFVINFKQQTVAAKAAANSTFKGKVTLLFILIILQQYFLILHISIYNILLKLLNYQYIISSAICKSTMIFLHPIGLFV